MTKQELRALYKAKRMTLTESDFDKMNSVLPMQWQKLPIPFITHMMSYFPLSNTKEPDPQTIEHFAHDHNPGLSISFPRITGDDSMEAIESKEYNLTLNKYNIFEIKNGDVVPPKLLDVVIVPLLAFDKNGNRVGYGKGFYDRFLARCKKNIVKVGISFFDAVDSIDDADEYDVPLTYCLTPDKVYYFD